jgi:excisionase family DNA binding protein
MNNLSDYVTIKQASELLGVSPSTLRNWDRSGKVKAWRHPLNGYRLYGREQLEALHASLLPGDALESNDAR